jgi:hypothetical protein
MGTGMFRAFGLALSALALVLLASCGKDEAAPPPASDASAVETGAQSEAAALPVVRAEAPPGWYVAESALVDAMMERGGEMMAGDNAALKAISDAAKSSTVPIFTYFKHPPGTPDVSNPGVVALAENVAIAPGVRSGRDYLKSARSLLTQGTIEVAVLDETGGRTIGGQDFDSMTIEMSMPGMAVTQIYHAKRRDDFVIVFIQSYVTEAEKLETDAVLDAVELDW